jgi:hypothetical protein
MKQLFKVIIDYDEDKIVNNKVNGVEGLKKIMKNVEDKFK